MKLEIVLVDRETALRCVGRGWHSLVNNLYNLIEDFDIPVGVHQVKEKFGELRFYYEWLETSSVAKLNPVFFAEAVRHAEAESSKICELCGQPGEPSATNGWIRTLCDEHSVKP